MLHLSFDFVVKQPERKAVMPEVETLAVTAKSMDEEPDYLGMFGPLVSIFGLLDKSGKSGKSSSINHQSTMWRCFAPVCFYLSCLHPIHFAMYTQVE